jgi:hypothetical protein
MRTPIEGTPNTEDICRRLRNMVSVGAGNLARHVRTTGRVFNQTKAAKGGEGKLACNSLILKPVIRL